MSITSRARESVWSDFSSYLSRLTILEGVSMARNRFGSELVSEVSCLLSALPLGGLKKFFESMKPSVREHG